MGGTTKGMRPKGEPDEPEWIRKEAVSDRRVILQLEFSYRDSAIQNEPRSTVPAVLRAQSPPSATRVAQGAMADAPDRKLE